MNPTNPISTSHQEIAITGPERWDIYHRLQELGITCQCCTHQLVNVEVSSPNDLIQVWSVVKQITSSRKNSVLFLKSCWEKSSVY